MPAQETPREFHLLEVEQKAYELLAKKRERIELSSFADLYEKGVIEKDELTVREIEKTFSSDKTKEGLKKLSELFEVLFSKLVELEDWLGDDVFVVETSTFDDYVNGVDAVAEFLREGSLTHLGLAIDVTFTSDTQKKITKIRDEIKGGKLPLVRYFVSESGDFRGELSNIPRVVLGTDRKTLDELAELWLDFLHLRKRKQTLTEREVPFQLTQKIREVKEKLQNHPLQIELLAQIELQLESFGKYAASLGKTDIALKYKSVLAIIRKIRDGKKEIENSPETKTREMKMFHDIEHALNSILPAPASE